MAKHPNSKVFVSKGKASVLELWANREDGTAFCKIKITRETTRFRVETNYLGDGKFGLSCPATIEKAVEGFMEFDELEIRIFNSPALNAGQWIDMMKLRYVPEMKG